MLKDSNCPIGSNRDKLFAVWRVAEEGRSWSVCKIVRGEALGR